MIVTVAPFDCHNALHSAVAAAVRVAGVVLLPTMINDVNLRINASARKALEMMSAEAVVYLAAGIFFVVGLVGGTILLDGFTKGAKNHRLRILGLHDQRRFAVRCNRILFCLTSGALVGSMSLLASLLVLLRGTTPPRFFETDDKRQLFTSTMLMASCILVVDVAAVEFFSGGEQRLLSLILNYFCSCELLQRDAKEPAHKEPIDEEQHAENVVNLMAKVDEDLRTAGSVAAERGSIGTNSCYTEDESTNVSNGEKREDGRIVTPSVVERQHSRTVSSISSLTFASFDKDCTEEHVNGASELNYDDSTLERDQSVSDLDPSGVAETPEKAKSTDFVDREAFVSFANAIRLQSPAPKPELDVEVPERKESPRETRLSVKIGPVQQLRKSGTWPNQIRRWKDLYLWASPAHIRLFRLPQDTRIHPGCEDEESSVHASDCVDSPPRRSLSWMSPTSTKVRSWSDYGDFHELVDPLVSLHVQDMNDNQSLPNLQAISSEVEALEAGAVAQSFKETSNDKRLAIAHELLEKGQLVWETSREQFVAFPHPTLSGHHFVLSPSLKSNGRSTLEVIQAKDSLHFRVDTHEEAAEWCTFLS